MASRLDLVVLNQGTTTTFRRPGYRETITDISLASQRLAAQIEDWHLVSTILKIDISSIIKTIDEHDYLKETQQIKIFYIKCIILLNSTKTLKDLEEIVLSLLVLVLSPYETEETTKT